VDGVCEKSDNTQKIKDIDKYIFLNIFVLLDVIKNGLQNYLKYKLSMTF